MKVRHHQLMECGRTNVKHVCMHVFLVQAQRRADFGGAMDSYSSDLFTQNLDGPAFRGE